nr:Ca-activated chloride channel [Candidatus Cloacimonadota bacterium]
MLYLLLLLPILIWLIAKSDKRFLARFSSFADKEFKDIFLQDRSSYYTGLKLLLIVLALGFVIVALSRPQWDYRQSELESEGSDIIFAIDVSRSMEATDIQPSRLTRSILQVLAFVEQLQSDRLGVISFAGVASLECPLTEDHEAVKMVLKSLSTESAQRPGTDIARALDLARSAFQAGPGAGILILISDGEDIGSNALAKARDLAADGVRIYTIGIGSTEGGRIRNPYTGEERISRLNVDMLRQIAKVSSGEFYQITPSAGEIQLLLSRIYQSEKTKSQARMANLYEEQYGIFVIAAILLLLLESSFMAVKRRKKVKSQ